MNRRQRFSNSFLYFDNNNNNNNSSRSAERRDFIISSRAKRAQCVNRVWVLASCRLIALTFTCIQLFRERLSEKKVHATIPKGNMGYDQYTVPKDCSCRTYFGCFPLAIANITSQTSRAILSNFFEEQCRAQNHPQYLSGLSRALFPTTFLEIAVYPMVSAMTSYSSLTSRRLFVSRQHSTESD